jgi:hypothetical protein
LEVEAALVHFTLAHDERYLFVLRQHREGKWLGHKLANEPYKVDTYSN